MATAPPSSAEPVFDVSVVIPARDHLDQLTRVLASIRATTVKSPPTEILVIDDASEEDLAQVCASKDARLIQFLEGICARHIGAHRHTHTHIHTASQTHGHTETCTYTDRDTITDTLQTKTHTYTEQLQLGTVFLHRPDVVGAACTDPMWSVQLALTRCGQRSSALTRCGQCRFASNRCGRCRPPYI